MVAAKRLTARYERAPHTVGICDAVVRERRERETEEHNQRQTPASSHRLGHLNCHFISLHL